MDETLRVDIKSLNDLATLENTCLKIMSVLEASALVLEELTSLLVSQATDDKSAHTRSTTLANYRRQCIAYLRTATYLQQRVQQTSQLLTDGLLFRDQTLAKEQNKTMLKLNKSAVFITFLTLVYLPASFIAVSIRLHFHQVSTQKRTQAPILPR